MLKNTLNTLFEPAICQRYQEGVDAYMQEGVPSEAIRLAFRVGPNQGMVTYLVCVDTSKLSPSLVSKVKKVPRHTGTLCYDVKKRVSSLPFYETLSGMSASQFRGDIPSIFEIVPRDTTGHTTHEVLSFPIVDGIRTYQYREGIFRTMQVPADTLDAFAPNYTSMGSTTVHSED